MPPTRKPRILAAIAILLLAPFFAVLALFGWGWTQECISNRLSVVDVRPRNPLRGIVPEEIHVRISVRRGEDFVIWDGRPEKGISSKFGFYLPVSSGHYIMETRFSSGGEPRITGLGYVDRYSGLENLIVIGEHGEEIFDRWNADTYTNSYFHDIPYNKNLFQMLFGRLSCIEKLVD